MKQVAIVCSSPREIRFIEEPGREVAAHEVRVRTLFSGISSGTELTLFRGTNPYLHKQWDSTQRLFVDAAGASGLSYPITNWGYEEVGEVIEVGTAVSDLQPGSIVYGTWGHRTSAIIDAAFARDRQLPSHADPILGIFSHIGPIALNGILDSAIRVGETVAVFGLGVVGQLVAQLAALSGAEVIGVDMLPRRREIAQQLGAAHVIDAGAGSAAETIKALTAGRGADVCIEASGAGAALHEAIRACAYSSKVVALGFYQGAAVDLRLGEEFHHNRINLVCSQIGGSAPELLHRWNRLRLVQTCMRLAVQGKLQIDPLITHIMPAADAPVLFKLLDESPSDALQAVLDFRAGLSAEQVGFQDTATGQPS
jgi:2-desacetyl-2-hydroxyethyl bacteriochlorophyllide A dehydrogenase